MYKRQAYIASRISTLAKVEEARRSLQGKRLGCIGQPSDWLISSAADKSAVKEKLGIEIVDIPIEELISDVLSEKAYDLSEEVSTLKENIITQSPQAVGKYAEGAIKV